MYCFAKGAVAEIKLAGSTWNWNALKRSLMGHVDKGQNFGNSCCCF